MTDEHPALFRAKIPWIIWLLVVDAIILSLCVLGGGFYLRYRQQVADHRAAVANNRAEVERAALCGIFNHLPIGVDPDLDAARTAYRCAATVGRPLVISPTPTPTGAHHRVKPQPRVTKTVVVPRPELVLTPGPTVTVTKHSTATQPSRSGRHHHRAHHHPTASPTCISVLGKCVAKPPPISPIPLP